MPHQQAAVFGTDPVGNGPPTVQRRARASAADSTSVSARPGNHLSEVPGEATEEPLRQRPGTGRGPGAPPGWRADPGPASRPARTPGALVPAPTRVRDDGHWPGHLLLQSSAADDGAPR